MPTPKDKNLSACTGFEREQSTHADSIWPINSAGAYQRVDKLYPAFEVCLHKALRNKDFWTTGWWRVDGDPKVCVKIDCQKSKIQIEVVFQQGDLTKGWSVKSFVRQGADDSLEIIRDTLKTCYVSARYVEEASK